MIIKTGQPLCILANLDTSQLEHGVDFQDQPFYFLIVKLKPNLIDN